MENNSTIIQGLMRVDLLSDDELYELIKFDIENGITFFDTADIYCRNESERKLGRILTKHPELRQKMFIQTKCSIRDGYYDLSYDHIINSVNKSLERLNTPYIDSLLLHRPDIFIDNIEIKKAFNKLKEEGKVKHFGVSNFPKEIIKYLSKELKEDDIEIEYNQVQLGLGHTLLIDEIFNFNMNNKEGNNKTSELFFYMKRNNINLQAWSPFQVGFFEGNLFDENKYKDINVLLDELAKKYHCSKCAIASAFILNLGDNISLVTGSMNKKHIKECLDGTKIKLDKKDWYDLYKISGNFLP